MITVIIVEDEFDTRAGIKKHVSWKELGIDLVEEAENGLAAVNLCESIQPDILLTDVRMPKMDGLELAAYVRERIPQCKIIFLSGYSDKEYLKSAIRLGAINYIEKPINIEELQTVLRGAVQLHCAELKKKEEELELQSMLSENMPFILHKHAIALAYKTLDNKTFQNLVPALWNLPDDGLQACSTIIRLHQEATLADEEQEYLRSEMLTFLQHDIDLQKEFLYLLPGFLDSTKLLIHCFINGSSSENPLEESVKVLVDQIKRKYKGNFLFTAVIGQKVSSPQDIHTSFQSALKYLHRLFYSEKGQVYFYNMVPEPAYSFSENLFGAFEQRILGSSLSDVLEFLDTLADNISSFPDTDTGYVKNIYFKLFLLLFDISKKRNIETSIPESDGVYIWQEISKMDTIFDITSYLKTAVREYFIVIENKSAVGKSVYDIIHFIENHYSDQNLSIKSIAEYAHYDHYYMCTLFKKHTGKTLHDYITQVRIEKARELLKDKSIKLYDITGMIGYVDPSHFSKIFKKHVGFLPSEFREKYLL